MANNASGGLHNSSIEIPLLTQKAYAEEAYYMTTGSVTLTSAAETPLLYISNTSANRSMVLSRLKVVAELSDQFGTMNTKIYKENSGGTIESATADTPENLSAGSSKTLDADVRLGSSGTTFSATKILLEEHRYSAQLNGGGNNIIKEEDLGIVIPPGENIVICHTAPASNTSQVICIGVTVYLI